MWLFRNMTFVLFHSLAILILVSILLHRISAEPFEEIQGSGEGSGKASGSGEEPTEIVNICDDEDSECDPLVKYAYRKTTQKPHTLTTTTSTTKSTTTESPLPIPTNTKISTTPSENQIVIMATTKPPVPKYTIGQPRFRGNSFMELPRLPPSSRRSVELAVTFKADDRNGLLLYAGRRSKEKDFLAVGLVDGFVELRFNNGADTIAIKTPETVTLGQWHKLVVFRNKRDGYITLDYGKLVRGTSKQKQNYMNLNTPLYLGGLVDFNTINIPYRQGFKGCIQELVVDGKRLDLRFSGGDAKRTREIDDCKNSSRNCLCKNGGTCRYNNRGEWLCACPLGFAGHHCEREIKLQIPSFNGNSFLAYPSTGKVASNSFTISVTLKPVSETGLILLNTEHAKGEGDFYSLSLREGIVEFLFDCGSGAAIIRSREPIHIEEWHTITIWRIANKGSLTIDNGLPVYGQSPGYLHHINLRQNLYIGGMQDYKHQPRQMDMNSGFVGCIQKVTINFRQLNLASPRSGVSVDNCNHVCLTKSICQNGGTCQAVMDRFLCRCPVGYTGMFCDSSLNIRMPAFTGHSFLSYPSLGQNVYYSFFITLVVKPRMDTGLILYNGQHENKKGDYISLALREGFVEFSFDCGSGAAKMRSKSKVVMDQWYTITIAKKQRRGKLVIDNGKPVFGKSPGLFRYITLKRDLFLGGMEKYAQQPLDNAVRTGFVGCIQKVTVNSKELDFSTLRSGTGVRNCEHVCVTHHICLNGGKCHADLDSFKCKCTSRYTGMMCEKEVTPSIGHFFDGKLFVEITRRKIMRRVSGPNAIIQMQFKSKSSQALLLYIQPTSYNTTYFLINLNNGKAEVRYKNTKNNEKIISSKKTVNDDQWHKLHFMRTSSEWRLQVDKDITTDKHQLQNDPFAFHHGKMFIGGLPDHVVTSWPNLVGSVRELVIGRYKVDIEDVSVLNIRARRHRMHGARDHDVV